MPNRSSQYHVPGGTNNSGSQQFNKNSLSRRRRAEYDEAVQKLISYGYTKSQAETLINGDIVLLGKNDIAKYPERHSTINRYDLQRMFPDQAAGIERLFGQYNIDNGMNMRLLRMLNQEANTRKQNGIFVPIEDIVASSRWGSMLGVKSTPVAGEVMAMDRPGGPLTGKVRGDNGTSMYVTGRRAEVRDDAAAITTQRTTATNGRRGDYWSRRSSSEIKELQQMLSDLGYDLGKSGVDGKMGKFTRKALRDFIQDQANERSVRELQQELVDNGYLDNSSGRAVDGVAGLNTVRALKGYIESGAGRDDDAYGSFASEYESPYNPVDHGEMIKVSPEEAAYAGEGEDEYGQVGYPGGFYGEANAVAGGGPGYDYGIPEGYAPAEAVPAGGGYNPGVLYPAQIPYDGGRYILGTEGYPEGIIPGSREFQEAVRQGMDPEEYLRANYARGGRLHYYLG